MAHMLLIFVSKFMAINVKHVACTEVSFCIAELKKKVPFIAQAKWYILCLARFNAAPNRENP